MEPYTRDTFLRELRALRDRFDANVDRGREKAIIVRAFDDAALWSQKVPEFNPRDGIKE